MNIETSVNDTKNITVMVKNIFSVLMYLLVAFFPFGLGFPSDVDLKIYNSNLCCSFITYGFEYLTIKAL